MKVRCPHCGSKGLLSADLAGRMVRCARCGNKFEARVEVGGDQGNKWYYAEGNEKRGPFTEEEFGRLVSSGVLSATTLVWHKGMQGWQVLGEVQQAKPHIVAIEKAGTAPARAAETPVSVEATEGISSLVKPEVESVGLVYAGGGKRLFAKIVDLVFMGVMASLVEILSRKLFPDDFVTGDGINKVYLVTMLLSMLLGMFYIVWFVGKFGATPGKMVLRLKVVTPAGGRVDYMHAFGRYWSEFVVIWLTFGVGYLSILYDQQKRGLHDRLCSTRVVQV